MKTIALVGIKAISAIITIHPWVIAVAGAIICRALIHLMSCRNLVGASGELILGLNRVLLKHHCTNQWTISPHTVAQVKLQQQSSLAKRMMKRKRRKVIRKRSVGSLHPDQILQVLAVIRQEMIKLRILKPKLKSNPDK